MPLASYAVSDSNSQGRQFPLADAVDRNQFQRDYARVLNSQAFRRLQQKTQVFSANLGDLFRTRITHSLEVDQLARSVARELDLNEDLCGVLAIAHDIGHAPFGHMGQDELDRYMKAQGAPDGFEHNFQALRLIDQLENAYPTHPGLNLMFETREGLLKHCTPARARTLGAVAARHLDGRAPTLEAQVVDWADAIAYVHADLQDAIMMGVIGCDMLFEVPGYAQAWERVAPRLGYPPHPTADEIAHEDEDRARVAKCTVLEVTRDMMAHALRDLVDTSRRNLQRVAPASPEEARMHHDLIGFSAGMLRQHRKLKAFSREHIYRHPSIRNVREAEKKILLGLLSAYTQEPTLLPGRPVAAGTPEFLRRLADHVSGMTDRYAVDVFERLRRERPHLIPPAYRDADQAQAADSHHYPKPDPRARRKMVP